MYDLRVCVTQRCNFKCKYCSKDGEGIYSENPALDEDELVKYISLLCDIGVSSVRFTGGEPFCRNNFLQLAKKVKRIKGIDSVSLVTNASMLNDKVIEEMAKENIFSYVSVSLDSLDKYKFQMITGSNAFEIVIGNIKKLSKKGIPTRINFVLTKDNLNEFEDLLAYCILNKVDIKILDLYNNLENYVKTDAVEQILKLHNFAVDSLLTMPGNLGTVMKVYKGNNINVIVKNSNEKTTYSDVSCKKCPRYPCQLGLNGPILCHDGIIKICSLGRETGINCFRINDISALKRIFENKMKMKDGWNSETRNTNKI